MRISIPTTSEDEPVESASSRAARVKREDAERKREERRRRKEAGIPDPVLVDRAIVEALRKVMTLHDRGTRAGELPVGKTVPFDAVIRAAAFDLQGRGYQGPRIGEALIARLATA